MILRPRITQLQYRSAHGSRSDCRSERAVFRRRPSAAAAASLQSLDMQEAAIATVPVANPTLEPEPAVAPAAVPRARIVMVESKVGAGDTQAEGGAAAAAEAARPTLTPNTLPPHDWEAIERRRKLAAQRRAADAGKRLHAFEERRQSHVAALKKEVLRAEAAETPLQPTFYTPATSRGFTNRRSSFGERLCPPKEHLHRRFQSREQQSKELSLRGCTFQVGGFV